MVTSVSMKADNCLARWSGRAELAKGQHKAGDTPLSLHGSYHLHWSDYSDLPSKYGRFRYLAVEVWRGDETSPVAVERSSQVASYHRAWRRRDSRNQTWRNAGQ